LEGQSDTEEKVQDILERILSQPTYKDRRAKNLDLDDFLHLLAEFHREGIHFTS
jgi:16S rRNA A1518/A1519 N6-dimethyltransferase RsmA/KsgA/DIM1 with predicted DNA glycosylase/AP lyase activity